MSITTMLRAFRPSLSAWELRAHRRAESWGRRGCRRRNSRYHRLLEACAVRYHQTFENLDYDMQRNGESAGLRLLPAENGPCVFDVGANRGEWATMAAGILPDCRVHSFEVAPPTFEKLCPRVADNPRISANGFGLGASRQTNVL